jgi:hypothetical protein
VCQSPAVRRDYRLRVRWSIGSTKGSSEEARLLSLVRSSLRVPLPGDCQRSKDLEESVGMRLQGLVALVGSVMSPSAAPTNVYPCEVPSVWIQGDPIAPNGVCERVSKKISGQMGGSGRPPSEFHGAKTLHLQVFCSALGRTRTCGLLIRSQTLYPAELRAHRSTHDTAGWGISQGLAPKGRFCGYTLLVTLGVCGAKAGVAF